MRLEWLLLLLLRGLLPKSRKTLQCVVLVLRMRVAGGGAEEGGGWRVRWRDSSDTQTPKP